MVKKTALLLIFMMILFSQCSNQQKGIIMTVNGPLPLNEMGISLTHEHILVDFIGADSISENRWDDSKVIARALPFLKQIRELGCRTLVECTPEYIGRDPLLLKSLSDSSGLNILTNTGYYGASDNKFIPLHAYTETADQLAQRWVNESVDGINGTGVKPGFIKIGVAGGNLSELHRKLVTASARTHLKTGLTIVSHTGPSVPAFEQLEILQKEGVSPEAFIWVHAQSEKDIANHVRVASMGAWIGLDGLNDNNLADYVRMIKNLKGKDLLNKILLSHDAGWYRPGEENGGEFRGYSTLFEKLIPLLREEKFSDQDINQLLIINPSKAFEIRIRRNSKS
jgi:phosphotriesterase-related protein